MKYDPMTCPTCDAAPNGTLETVMARADFTEPDDHGHVNHTGYTTIFWNSQTTVTSQHRNQVTLLCHNDHQWLATEVDPSSSSTDSTSPTQSIV